MQWKLDIKWNKLPGENRLQPGLPDSSPPTLLSYPHDHLYMAPPTSLLTFPLSIPLVAPRTFQFSLLHLTYYQPHLNLHFYFSLCTNNDHMSLTTLRFPPWDLISSNVQHLKLKMLLSSLILPPRTLSSSIFFQSPSSSGETEEETASH